MKTTQTLTEHESDRTWGSSWKRVLPHLTHLTLLTLLTYLTLPAAGEVPEPDNVIYGLLSLGNSPVTAAQTNVVIEARKTANGPVISSYTMGSEPVFGSFYSLRVGLEAFNPLNDTNSHRVGGLVYLTVRDDSGVRDQRTLSIVNRGQLVRLDFVELDSDNDGLPDHWEQQYFGNTTGGRADVDADGDGRNNLREYLERTHPLVSDGRHPADISSSDYLLSFDEVDGYATAWLSGDLWPASPTNIPISYVTRAAALAMSRGRYVFTNAPPTNAPMSWVAVPTGPPATGTNRIASVAPPQTLSGRRSLTVIIRATPRTSTLAYAVQDAFPTNWTVQSISHGGTYDWRNRLIKWGPFYDDGERDLSYTVVPPANATGTVSFSGTGSFDGFNVAVSGNRAVRLSGDLVWSLAATDATGAFFRVSGAPLTSYVIESSTNLVNWQSLQTLVTGPDGTSTFRPPAPSQSRQRYFRARTEL